MSILQPTGLSVIISEPLVRGGTVLKDIAPYVSSYSHETGADMGYLSATIVFSCGYLEAQEWLIYGLGRDVSVRDMGGDVVWEGLVNIVSVAQGTQSREVGPLFEIGNRVYVIYTPLYIVDGSHVTAITQGTSMESPLVNNSYSQSLYGIIEKALNAGTCIVTSTSNEAHFLRDRFLSESAFPKIDQTFSFETSEPVTVTLDCTGYYQWLDAYIYNSRVSTSYYVTSSTKIKTILAANPNAWAISSDHSNITSNTAIVYSQERNNKTALTIIKGIVACGDPSGNRWIFGLTAGRRPYYRAIPSTHEYEYHISDNQQHLYYAGTSQRVKPWNIQPGKWYIEADFGLLAAPYRTLYENTAAAFIETVQYTAPYSFSLSESKVGTLAQLLAYKNLGTM